MRAHTSHCGVSDNQLRHVTNLDNPNNYAQRYITNRRYVCVQISEAFPHHFAHAANATNWRQNYVAQSCVKGHYSTTIHNQDWTSNSRKIKEQSETEERNIHYLFYLLCCPGEQMTAPTRLATTSAHSKPLSLLPFVCSSNRHPRLLSTANIGLLVRAANVSSFTVLDARRTPQSSAHRLRPFSYSYYGCFTHTTLSLQRIPCSIASTVGLCAEYSWYSMFSKKQNSSGIISE